MRNLAYVVNSANDNITSLSRTVKQQEKELSDKTEQAAALQRNYETLSRIRQADQKEFMVLKAHKVDQERQLQQLQEGAAPPWPMHCARCARRAALRAPRATLGRCAAARPAGRAQAGARTRGGAGRTPT